MMELETKQGKDEKGKKKKKDERTVRSVSHFTYMIPLIRRPTFRGTVTPISQMKRLRPTELVQHPPS